MGLNILNNKLRPDKFSKNLNSSDIQNQIDKFLKDKLSNRFHCIEVNQIDKFYNMLN